MKAELTENEPETAVDASMETEEPNKLLDPTLKFANMFTFLSIDTDEPKLANLEIDTLLPKEAKEFTERLEPRSIEPNKLNESPPI